MHKTAALYCGVSLCSPDTDVDVEDLQAYARKDRGVSACFMQALGITFHLNENTKRPSKDPPARAFIKTSRSRRYSMK